MTSTMQVNFPAPSTLYMNLIAHWSMKRQKCPSSSRNQGGDGEHWWIFQFVFHHPSESFSWAVVGSDSWFCLQWSLCRDSQNPLSLSTKPIKKLVIWIFVLEPFLSIFSEVVEWTQHKELIAGWSKGSQWSCWTPERGWRLSLWPSRWADKWLTLSLIGHICPRGRLLCSIRNSKGNRILHSCKESLNHMLNTNQTNTTF